MLQQYVKCKTENCNEEIMFFDTNQQPENLSTYTLLKKNYYLCNKCGKVYPYLKEDHYSR